MSVGLEVAPAGVRETMRAGAGRALFILDWRNFDDLEVGAPPVAPYSHDRNLYQFAHEALKAGLRVSFARDREAAFKGDVLSVEQLYPFLLAQRAHIDPTDLSLITSSGLEWLNVRGKFGQAKVVAVMPALHMIESPLSFPSDHPEAWIDALRHHVDVIITQNARMKDIMVMMSHWLARWDPKERILVAPLGFVETDPPDELDLIARRARARTDLGLPQSDRLIVNAGGAWGWTDCDTFIEAMIAHLQRGASPVRAYFPGLRQSDNREANPVAEQIERLMARHPRMFGRRFSDQAPICIEECWADGRVTLPKVMEAADIGLSVSKDSFEGWQSHRVRFIDYLEHRLPVMCTTESILAGEAKQASLQVQAKDLRSYGSAFDRIAAVDNILPSMARAAGEVRRAYESGQTYGRALKQLLLLPPRDFSVELEESYVEFWRNRVSHEIKNDVMNRIYRRLGL